MKTACVIGGGISGLAAAYLLQRQGWAVTLVESSGRLGGNAYTMEVVQAWNADGTPIPESVRWVDMGVNDFNMKSYTHIVAMLDELGVPYAELIDQASFTSPDGAFPPSNDDFGGIQPYARYALDYVNYTLDPANLTPPPQNLQDAWTAFQQCAPVDAQDPAFANMTIEQYLQDAAAKGKIKNVDLLGKYCIYPRINGMYFTVDDTPQDMPFVGIMQYYVLQEGMGTPSGPQRRYWKNGTRSWIDALAAALQEPSAGQVPVRVLLDTQAQVSSSPTACPSVAFFDAGGNSTQQAQFDVTVFACHAQIALQSIKRGITQDQVNVLSAFEFKQSCTIAHTYAPALPVSKSLWRTYNICIHEGYDDLRPYTIDYVVNLHQNDPANPEYNNFNTPYLLYSINPHTVIPDKYILRQPIKSPKTGEYLKAVAFFPHNVVNLNSMWAQSVLWGTQWPYPNDPAFEYHWGSYEPGTPVQGQNGIYFTGGWTLLAGLHEQCWQSAIEVVNLIVGGSAHVHHYRHIPHHRHGSKEFMPASQRRAIA